jgi:hypothetical protein
MGEEVLAVAILRERRLPLPSSRGLNAASGRQKMSRALLTRLWEVEANGKNNKRVNIARERASSKRVALGHRAGRELLER